MSDESAQNLELLLEASRMLSSKLDVSDLLTTVMRFASRVVGSEQASLLLLDEATQELYFDVALGLDEDVAKTRLKLGQGIAGWVAQNGKPLIINDVHQDPRWSSDIDKASGFVTRSILASPMMIKGRVLGVVEAINRIDGPFRFQDLRTFEALASKAAVAIENARLFSSIKKEKQNLEAIFSEMREAAVLTDPRAHVLAANEMAKRLLGAGPSQSLAQGLEGLDVKPGIEEVLRDQPDLATLEVTREKPKPLILTGSAIRLKTEDKGNQQGWIWIFRDVTEERKAEGLKRDFLSLISHKLKTPLASITGYSQILLGEEAVRKLPEFPLKALGSIQTQGLKLQDLVEKLLNFVTLEGMDAGRIQRKPFSLQTAADAALKELQERLKTTPFEAKIDGAASAVGDPALVQEVFKNLIDNAVKFNPGSPKRVAVWLRESNGRAEAAVTDNGPGIPPEDIEKIFQKFHQVEASFTGQVEGWGLGLALSQRVLERLGGRLKLESSLGQGTTVTISLPKAAS